ncbi:MAG: GrpB family protein [Planctomycetota bacterium]|jgi:GrpB-like predicted nucleotidyltransferase (UPF0157 family)
MIGLKRNTVRVVDHEPKWAELYERELAIVGPALEGLAADIQHVGSTSVPGLPAKPILDIAVALETEGLMPELIERLSGVGYIYRENAGDDGGHLLVKEPEPDVRSVHLHVVESKDHQWGEYLAFRDTLRENPDIRKKYADMKRELAIRFPNDRKSYTSAKDVFIKAVLEEIRGE